MPATKIVAGVGGGGWICACVDAGHKEECVYTADTAATAATATQIPRPGQAQCSTGLAS